MWQRIIIASVALLVLAGGYYYYEKQDQREKKKAETSARLFPNLEPANAVGIDINGPVDSFTLSKKDGSWWITKPFQAEAGQNRIADLLETARDLKSEKSLGNKTSLEEYGLARPKGAVFKFMDGGAMKLMVGDLNASKLGYFVKTDAGPGVFLVKRWQIDDIMLNLFTARNRRLFARRPSEVTGLEYHNKSLTVSAGRQTDKSWKLTAPIQAKADRQAIDNLLDKFVNALISGFVDEDAKDMGKYGLDEPEVKFTAIFGKNNKKTLMIGGKTDNGNRYAAIAGSRRVVRVDGNIMTGLAGKVIDLRSTTLAPVEPEKVTKITVTLDGVKTELKTVGAQKRWEIISPVAQAADPVALSGFLYDIRNARAIGFADNSAGKPAMYGLDKPSLEITVTTADKEHNLRFSTSTAKGVRYAAVDNTGIVMEISEDTYGKLARGPEYFREKRFFALKPGDTGRIVVKRMGQVFDARKLDDHYQLVTPEQIRLTPTTWNRFMWTVTGLRFRGSMAKQNAGKNKAPLEKPRIEISVYDIGGALVDTVAIGSCDKTKHICLARPTNKAGLYTINMEFVTDDIISALEKLVAPQTDAAARAHGAVGLR